MIRFSLDGRDVEAAPGRVADDVGEERLLGRGERLAERRLQPLPLERQADQLHAAFRVEQDVALGRIDIVDAVAVALAELGARKVHPDHACDTPKVPYRNFGA